MSKLSLPTYLAKLPSTGKSVKYRPFTVREEKTLLLALQEDDADLVVEAIKNVIDACTNGTVDPTNIPYYDVEYLFLQIRSKSVGEIIELIGSCECGSKTDFEINISSLLVEPKPTGYAKIKIPDTNYTIEIRHPSIDDFVSTFKGDDSTSSQVVANCIVSVFTDEEVFTWTPEEKLEFVDSMYPKQQRDIAQFLKDMPLVKLPSYYKCKKCGSEHKTDLTGFQNFFI